MEYQKSKLVRILLDDFIKSFPESNRATRVELFSKLHGLEIKDLEVLVSQLQKEGEEK